MRAMDKNGIQEFVVTSPEMMGEVVEVVLAAILSSTNCSVVGLSGELGAGKTTFMRTFLSKVGVSNKASSPTFVIRKAYPVPENSVLAGRFKTVVHIDAYRLENDNEALHTGLIDDIECEDTLIFIEWPEKLNKKFFENTSFLGTLRFSHVAETVRKVLFDRK